MRLAVRRALSVAVAATVAVVLAAAGCASSGVNIEPDAQAGTAEVRAVVQLPVDLGYGGPPDVRRVQRRAGGAVIAPARGDPGPGAGRGGAGRDDPPYKKNAGPRG